MKKLFLFSLVLFSGCSVRSVYVPTSQNVLLFDDRKQVQTNAYVGGNHIELQIAHNPINHFTVGLNINYGAGLSIYEGSLGLYNYSKQDAKWRYELIAGAGYTNNYSQQNHEWFSFLKETKSNYETIALYSKFYIQPGFGFFSKIAMYKIAYSFSFTCRAAYLNFNKYVYREINADSSLIVNHPIYIVNKEFYNKGLFLFEPCITNKVGVKNVAAVIQGQFMIPYSDQIDIRYTKFSPVFIFSLGLQYTIPFKKRKAETQ